MSRGHLGNHQHLLLFLQALREEEEISLLLTFSQTFISPQLGSNYALLICGAAAHQQPPNSFADVCSELLMESNSRREWKVPRLTP